MQHFASMSLHFKNTVQRVGHYRAEESFKSVDITFSEKGAFLENHHPSKAKLFESQII